MKLCYHDAWLYTKVKRLKYKAAFFFPTEDLNYYLYNCVKLSQENHVQEF